MLGQAYRFQITSVMSLLHRVTGIVASFGAFVLAWWLLSVAQGGEAYVRAVEWLGSPLGRLGLFLVSLSVVYHLLNGIRHLMWDAGVGFDIPEVYRSGYTVLALSAVLTVLLWVVALRGGA
jgi:succinate dehydrogenase / fumarate reductase, cytochrome b subunit